MSKVFKGLIVLPAAVVIVAFAIANRQMVSISFDPFSEPSASSALITAPLYLLLFLVLVAGIFLGGVATWVSQGRNRQQGRAARDDAERWRDEARRLREQPPLIAPSMTRPIARQRA